MMRDYDRITHILGAIDDALESTDGVAKEDFMVNKDKRAAAERYVMIVGEAAHMVSEEMKLEHPEVEWDRITGLRNMIAHEYMRVDYSALWETVRGLLPTMRVQLAAIQAALPMPNDNLNLETEMKGTS